MWLLLLFVRISVYLLLRYLVVICFYLWIRITFEYCVCDLFVLVVILFIWFERYCWVIWLFIVLMVFTWCLLLQVNLFNSVAFSFVCGYIWLLFVSCLVRLCLY